MTFWDIFECVQEPNVVLVIFSNNKRTRKAADNFPMTPLCWGVGGFLSAETKKTENAPTRLTRCSQDQKVDKKKSAKLTTLIQATGRIPASPYVRVPEIPVV